MNKLTSFFAPKRKNSNKEQGNSNNDNDDPTIALNSSQLKNNIRSNNNSKKRFIDHVHVQQQQQEEEIDIVTNENDSKATSADIETKTNDETNNVKKQKLHNSTTGTTMYTPNVQLLIESLKEINDNDDDTNNKELSWRFILHTYFSTNKSFANLANFLQKERIQYVNTIYPSSQNVWTALNLCSSINKIKVIIVGQDPYHQPNQAHGLAFSVQKHIQKIPPSLLNIYKELASDTNVTVSFKNNTNKRPQHGSLEKWAQQGVLLLNTVLTVRYNEPNSHSKQYGWEQLTDKIIQEIVLYNTSSKTTPSSTSTSTDTVTMLQPKGVVFLLWGKPAYQKATTVLQSLSMTTSSNNNKNNIKIISTSHPSPLGATKTSTPFLGSQCFSKCNDSLVQMGHTPINWNVD